MTIKTLIAIVLSTSLLAQDEPTKNDPVILKLSTGKEYTNVVVRGRTLDGIKIVHSTGASTIPWDILPLEFKEKYKLTAEETNDLKSKKEAEILSIKKDRELATLKANSEEARFQIVSIDHATGGVLVQSMRAETNIIPGSSTNRYGGGGSSSLTYYTYTASGIYYWVSGMPINGLIDGYKFKMKYVEIGTHSYTTVQGSNKTVKKLKYISHSKDIK